MSDDDERSAITAAMQRLLAGRPLRSSGDLTIVTLAAEAGLKRNKLSHKHKDLKDMFYAEVKAREGVPASELKLREEIAALKTKVGNLRQERDDYRATAETFARVIHALTVENDNLRNDFGKGRSSTVTPCRCGSEPRRIEAIPDTPACSPVSTGPAPLRSQDRALKCGRGTQTAGGLGWARAS